MLGALYSDPRWAPHAERTVAIYAAFTEKITIEQNPLMPSSGQTGSGRGPNSCSEGLKVLRFRPPLGDLGATYDDHLRLIGKRVMDSLLVLIELLSLGVKAEALQAIIGLKSAISLQRVSVAQKFHIEGVAPYHPLFFSEK